MRIAVISDVHGAAAPFARALADARSVGFDQLVLLGDLFTYGVEPGICADLAQDAITNDGAILLGGNHDQLYVDLGAGRTSYFKSLPEWIRDSILWTWDQLDQSWPEGLQWQEEWICGEALFAHANPFGYGDWTYLADHDRLSLAADRLAARGLRWGVFGHLHRPMRHQTESGPTVHVVGSIGQPRSHEYPVPHWALIDLTDGALTLERQPVEFDPAAHRAAIHATTSLLPETREMLCKYFP